jgi:hypothetical protein
MQNAIAASKPKIKYEERYSFLNIMIVFNVFATCVKKSFQNNSRLILGTYRI